jgi:addiction module HigA family antidote
MDVYGFTQDRLAAAMGVSRFRVNEVINNRRAVTAETALLLSRALGTSPQFWLNLQNAVDLYDAEHKYSERIERVEALLRSGDETFDELPDPGDTPTHD